MRIHLKLSAIYSKQSWRLFLAGVAAEVTNDKQDFIEVMEDHSLPWFKSNKQKML